MIHKYALSDYQLAITLPISIGGLDKIITIGGTGDNGEGSFLGEISVDRKDNTYETSADVTGSWVHNMSRAINGTIRVKINQISDDVVTLINICNYYYDNFADGVTITISKANNTIVTGNDCYITKMPQLSYGDSAGDLDWEFTCGQIMYNVVGANI
jgi:hypothetical protein